MTFFESLGIVLGIVLVLVLIAFAVASWLLPRRTVNYLETAFDDSEARYGNMRKDIENLSDRLVRLERAATKNSN